MEKIYSKKETWHLLHIVHRASDITEQRDDVAPPDQFLQMAAMKLPAGKTFRPHKHPPRLLDVLEVGAYKVANYRTQESWIVIKGKVKCFFYDIDDTIISESILEAGDCSMTFLGGHSYEILEDDTVVRVLKLGPYEGPQKDKIFI